MHNFLRQTGAQIARNADFEKDSFRQRCFSIRHSHRRLAVLRRPQMTPPSGSASVAPRFAVPVSMFAALASALALLGRYGTQGFALSIFLGLALPQFSAAARPLLPITIFCFTTVVFMRADLGVIAGLIGGGLLMAGDIAGLGWRSVFLINVPICVVALVGSWVSVPESRGARAQRLDLVGALLAAVLLPAVLVPLAVGGSLGWPVWTWACLTASVIVLVGLVRHQRALERRDLDPIIPPRLFARPGFSLCMLLVVLFFAGNAGLFLVLTYHLQAGLELGPLATGLVFTPLGAGFVLGSTVSKGLVARFGSRVSVAGALLICVGLLIPFV